MEVGKRPLTSIPGVGKSIAQDLADLGFTGVEDLRGEDPQQMYDRLCALRGSMIDRCMLYVFRCAVFFCANGKPARGEVQMVVLEGS